MASHAPITGAPTRAPSNATPLDDAYCMVEQAEGVASLLLYRLEDGSGEKDVLCAMHALQSLLRSVQHSLIAAFPPQEGH